MLPFAFSLVLPLLAGVNTPTWSLREVDEFPDLRTLEAAGLLLPGTCRLVVEALPPTNPAPPWWMLCSWTGAPRSPDPAAAGVATCNFDDRYQKFGGAAAEPWTVELVTSAKRASSNISYATLIQHVIWVKLDLLVRRAQHTVTLYKFPWPLWGFSEYETDVIRFPDPTTRPFSLPPLTFSPSRAHGMHILYMSGRSTNPIGRRYLLLLQQQHGRPDRRPWLRQSAGGAEVALVLLGEGIRVAGHLLGEGVDELRGALGRRHAVAVLPQWSRRRRRPAPRARGGRRGGRGRSGSSSSFGPGSRKAQRSSSEQLAT